MGYNNIREVFGASRKIWPTILFCTVISAALILVEFHSFASGARANQDHGFSISAMTYGFLELLGVAGLGPGRNELKSSRSIRFELISLSCFRVPSVASLYFRPSSALIAGLPFQP